MRRVAGVTWAALNDILRNCDLATAKKLWAQEKSGPNRRYVKERITQRIVFLEIGNIREKHAD